MPADKPKMAEVVRMAEQLVETYPEFGAGIVAHALLALLPVVEAAQAWRNESPDATEPLTRLQREIVDSLAALDKEFPNE